MAISIAIARLCFLVLLVLVPGSCVLISICSAATALALAVLPLPSRISMEIVVFTGSGDVSWSLLRSLKPCCCCQAPTSAQDLDPQYLNLALIPDMDSPDQYQEAPLLRPSPRSRGRFCRCHRASLAGDRRSSRSEEIPDTLHRDRGRGYGGCHSKAELSQQYTLPSKLPNKLAPKPQPSIGAHHA